jgi:ADP-heptose:LPS heptosyltransferase
VLLPLLAGEGCIDIGTIYRPFSNPGIEAWVQRSRSRFGVKLFSRRAGVANALRFLRSGGALGVLFDQNAGDGGALTLLLGRVCSTTPMTGWLARQGRADVLRLLARRDGFWRATFTGEIQAPQPDDAAVAIALDAWLEGLLRDDDAIRANWLWSHSRWRTQDVPSRRLRIQHKETLLDHPALRARHPTLPRRTRFWVRLPNWLGDVCMVLPLLRTLRASRPDAELTLVGPAHLASLVELAGVADAFVPLPRRGAARWRLAASWRHQFPDTFVLFTHSARGDLEAWLSRAPQRFGIVRYGHWRPLLTHAWRPGPGTDGPGVHQAAVWEGFLRHFGLELPVDRAPLRPHVPPFRPRYGLICGTENAPEKRWPVEQWRVLGVRLLAEVPESTLALFGTARDVPIAEAVAAGLPPGRVDVRAGRTDLRAFAGELQGCSAVISNDTGGMHLANALGVPVAGLFGPTNPVRTGPCWDAPALVIQPPGCPEQGGAPMEAIGVDLVWERLSAAGLVGTGADPAA